MLWTERIESLKAGVLGAIASGGTALLIPQLLTHLPSRKLSELLLESPLNRAEWLGNFLPLNVIFSLGVAIASGFLFGVTYRYIIRQDDSSHLRSGAVLAFAIVRGLAQLEQRGIDERWVAALMGWRSVGFSALSAELLPELIGAGTVLAESWFIFGFARLLLDLSLGRGWLRPFG